MEVEESKNSVHVTQNCSTRKCAEYAVSFFSPGGFGMSGGPEAVLRLHAKGRAISKLVTIVEIVKDRYRSDNDNKELCQTNRIWRNENRSMAEFCLARPGPH